MIKNILSMLLLATSTLPSRAADRKKAPSPIGVAEVRRRTASTVRYLEDLKRIHGASPSLDVFEKVVKELEHRVCTILVDLPAIPKDPKTAVALDWFMFHQRDAMSGERKAYVPEPHARAVIYDRAFRGLDGALANPPESDGRPLGVKWQEIGAWCPGGWERKIHQVLAAQDAAPPGRTITIEELLLRGFALNGVGRKLESEKIYSQVIEKEPADPRAYFQRAALKMERGDFKASIPDLTKYAEFQPDDTETQEMLGRSYEKVGNGKAALQAYSKAVELSHNHSLTALRSRGMLTLDYCRSRNCTGDFYRQAEQDLLAAQKLDSADKELPSWVKTAREAAVVAEASEADDRFEETKRAIARKDAYRPSKNIFTMMGEGFGNVATSISNANSGSSGSGSSSYAASPARASSSGSSASANRAADFASGAYRERREAQESSDFRKQIDQKFWDMNKRR